jgi:hypothetical protein
VIVSFDTARLRTSSRAVVIESPYAYAVRSAAVALHTIHSIELEACFVAKSSASAFGLTLAVLIKINSERERDFSTPSCQSSVPGARRT